LEKDNIAPATGCPDWLKTLPLSVVVRASGPEACDQAKEGMADIAKVTDNIWRRLRGA
jgi:hypothetical protein